MAPAWICRYARAHMPGVAAICSVSNRSSGLPDADRVRPLWQLAQYVWTKDEALGAAGAETPEGGAPTCMATSAPHHTNVPNTDRYTAIRFDALACISRQYLRPE
jgi:hypothetical protein